jgi:hypothetical protein
VSNDDGDLTALERQLREVKRSRAYSSAMDRVDRRLRLASIVLGTVLIAIGAVAWVKRLPMVALFFVVLGLAIALDRYLPMFMTPRILRRIPWLRRRSKRPTRAGQVLAQLVALAPAATTDADYGPNGKQVARLIALLERLTPAQWERLEETTMRSAKQRLAESKRMHDRELASREASLGRRIALKRQSPWDTETEDDESRPDWLWAYLAALRRLEDLRVGGEPPPGLALLPVRQALKALVRRGIIDESEFLADWGPFSDALGSEADNVLHS